MPSPLVAAPDRGRAPGEGGTARATASNSSSQDRPTLSGSTPRNGSIDRKHAPVDTDEQSPLLSPSREDEAFIDGDGPLGADFDVYETKSVWFLMLLTVSIGGLQIAWCVELSNGSPYLLSLGLSKSLMALVWIAGPLSGTLVQPYVGMLSDNCRISWGKRKPFMLGGTVATVLSLMFLAWTKDIVNGILSLFGADPESQFVRVSVIITAVIWVYVLDFSINVVQAAIRAFIVDCAPPHQQEAANAMASRVVGVGNILGYVAGYVDLPRFAWWLGYTQFQDLCAIASISLIATVAISCLFIQERDPRLEGQPAASQSGVLSFFAKIFVSMKRLPPQIKKVCMVQFFSWIGFFPMLFYTTSYIAEIYAEPFLEENPNMTPEELNVLYEKATRVGTFALLIYSITSLTTNIFLPFFIAPTYDSQPVAEASGEGDGTGLDEAQPQKKTWLDRLVIHSFTLRRAWMLSLLLFTGSMFCTVLVRTVEAATVLIGLVGITWALTLWAPWAIISGEIARRDTLLRAEQRRLFAENRSGDDLPSLDGFSDQDRDVEATTEKEEVDQAGVILGIHNMAIAAPQIIGTVVSSIIFKFFQKPRGTPGDHSIAINLALGGITVLIAAWVVSRIEDEVPVAEVVEEPEPIPSARTSSELSRSKSFERTRASQDRATLIRSNSQGGGLEY